MQNSFSFFHILTIIGSLGFFMYGMKVMSDGIQKVAGENLRGFLDKMTGNRFKAIFTGFSITSVVQSSSATTVMIVSFVNAGLLSLRQAIGVIMGANIGTTMTGWIIALIGFKFKISDYALPVLAVGVPMLFFKHDRFRFWGEFLIGFGLLFLGLESLKNAVEALDLGSNPAFIHFITDLKNEGMSGILLFVLIGTMLTIVVQSSSAAMALTLTFIDSGLPFTLAAAIVLGENIGTTITANLAAVMANTHAKRAARAHFIFNVFGAVWMLCIFNYFTHWVFDFFDNYVVPQSSFISSDNDATRYALTFFHSSFNIINTLLLVGFVPQIEQLVVKFVPNKKSQNLGKEEDTFKLEYITAGVMSTAELSLLEAKKEITKFARITKRMFDMLKRMSCSTDKQETQDLLDRVRKNEIITDRFEEAIVNFLTQVARTGLSDKSSVALRSMLAITHDLERIGDICYNISRDLHKKQAESMEFGADQIEKLEVMIGLVEQAFQEMLNQFMAEQGENALNNAYATEKEINELMSEFKRQYLQKIEQGEWNIQSGIMFNNIFYALERIGDHLINVSEAVNKKI